MVRDNAGPNVAGVALLAALLAAPLATGCDDTDEVIGQLSRAANVGNDASDGGDGDGDSDQDPTNIDTTGRVMDGGSPAGNASGQGSTCDFDAALEKAEIPVEVVGAIIECKFPASWLRSPPHEQSEVEPNRQREIIEELFAGTLPIQPEPGTRAADFCGIRGLWYWDRWPDPTTVHLCPSFCTHHINFVTALLLNACDGELPVFLLSLSDLARLTEAVRAAFPPPRPTLSPDDEEDDAGIE